MIAWRLKMSIKDKIEKLTLQERRQLSHAFDCQVSQYVEFGNNEFVGVHLDPNRLKHLNITKSVGVWSYGTVKK